MHTVPPALILPLFNLFAYFTAAFDQMSVLPLYGILFVCRENNINLGGTVSSS